MNEYAYAISPSTLTYINLYHMNMKSFDEWWRLSMLSHNYIKTFDWFHCNGLYICVYNGIDILSIRYIKSNTVRRTLIEKRHQNNHNNSMTRCIWQNSEQNGLYYRKRCLVIERKFTMNWTLLMIFLKAYLNFYITTCI